MAEAESTPLRVCKGCEKAFPATLEVFPPHRMGKFGLYTHCRACKKAQDAERRRRPDQLARQKAWRDANKEKIRAYNVAYREAGYVSTEHVRAWVAANLEQQREYARAKHKRYRETKPWYALKMRIAQRMRQMLAGNGGKARRKTEELLGYRMNDLVVHMERQFSDGMSWDAFLRGEIEIDHIIPVAHFKPAGADSDEFRACWALANLRPMWADENARKGAKVLTLL